MAKTGPQRYPGASTAYWYGSKYPGSAMETNVIVWHTTEGTSLPSYGGGTSAPNFTAKPDFKAKRLVWYQHFDFDVSARALVNKSGGVETNTLNVCQVEIVGTCDPTTHKKWGSTPHLYTPELPDWAIRDLAAFAKWANQNHSVPLSSGLTFKAYPGSYGNSSVRMSAARWNSFKGHCGHQHVPENDHGDPGALPMAAILAAAKGGTTAPEEDEDPMAGMSKADICAAVWETDGVVGVPDGWGAPGNTEWKPASILIDAGKRIRGMEATLAAQAATIDKLADALAGGAGADLEALKREIRSAIESVAVRLEVAS